jgi:uncharacterized protein YndB with AHSA1/START domain
MPRDDGDTIAPVQKAVRVKGSVEAAFRLFTDGIAKWWPLATHSVCQNDAVTCAVEGRVGGRVFERDRAGREHLWGTIMAWEPPSRFVFTWHPGRAADTAQEIELRFSDAGAGMTLVELTHSGWAKLGEKAATARENYNKGWETVFVGCYGKAAESLHR